jgi:hypothetical protein
MLPLLAGAVKRAIAGTMTPCPQSQIGRCCYLPGWGTAQVEVELALSVAARWGPVMTAVNGTLGARPARTTMLPPAGDGFQLGWRVRPVCVPHCLVDSREAARPSGSCGISPPVNLVLISRHLQVCRLPSKQPIVR